MKRLLSLLLCLMMALSLIPAAAAEDIEIVGVDDPEEIVVVEEPADGAAAVPNAIVASGACGDNIQWYLYETGEMSLTGSGDMWNFHATDPVPWGDYLNSIKTLTIGSGITSIGNRAFSGCSNLKLRPDILESLNGIRVIGYAAFANCTSLDYVFIPDTVTSIAENAFAGCTNLKHVTIAGSPALGPAPFYGCSSLEAISLLSDTAPSFSDDTFDGTPWITVYYPPDNSSFSACVGQNYGGELSWSAGLHGWCGDDVDWELGSDGRLTIYGSGPTWANPSFRVRAGSIKSAYVGPGVTDLADYFFYYLTNLTAVTLPDTITGIGSYCFYYDAMRSIEIPAAVTKIDSSAFVKTGLTSIRFLGHAPTIAPSAFSGLSGVTARYYPLADWKESVWSGLGGSITWVCDDKLGADVTWKLSSAGKLTLSGSGATWDYSGSDHPGFWHVSGDCRSLTVGSGITELGEEIFNGLDCLTSATLPASLTGIGSYAFDNCVDLAQIVFKGSAPSFGSSCFYNIRNLTACYPSGDTSWTDSVRKNYGADRVTWKAVAKPVITTQPASKTAVADETVQFTVKASGDSLSYQWYYRTSSAGEWKKSTGTGATTKTLPVEAKSYRSGYQYRCKVSNAMGYKYSTAATLTVTAPVKPTISTQPKSQSAAVGSTVQFSVTAAGGGLSYQWYYRTGSDGEWKQSTGTGATTRTLSVEAKSYRDGYQYRCKVSNTAGYKYSSAATLTVVVKPTITTQPSSKTAAAGTTVKFTVKADGGDLSYQWYYRTSSTGSWTKCTGTGATSATLPIEAKSYRSGYQYRCLVKNAAGSVYTRAVTLTVQ